MQDKVRVEARGVTLSYGRTPVLCDVNLVIEPGEFFALLGPSGSGKSTLLRLIAGFNRAQAGQILIGDEDVSRVPPWRRNVGMVFQNYALWPHMTVRENVAFGLEERRLSKPVIAEKVAAALALVNLDQYAQRRPGQLSGGQQQRVALARTVAVEPRVLLLDEPLSNLDAKLRVHMREELRVLQRKLGITTIFVTHDQEEAMTTADRIAVMDQGVIRQIGTPIDLFDHPANRFVASFVGTINLLPASLQVAAPGEVSLAAPALGTIRLPRLPHMPEAGEVEIGFRPHAVTLRATGAARDPEHVWLQGTVADYEFLGEFVRYRIRVGAADIIADQPHFSGSALIAAGSPADIGIRPGEMRFITG